MTTRPPRPRLTRACPHCGRATERVARDLTDRVLSLLMPVKRYRCEEATCGWEGLLLSRQRRGGRVGVLRDAAAVSEVATSVQRSPALIAVRARGGGGDVD